MGIRGGENMERREVEELWLGQPDIRDVQVIGVPDAKYGEEVMACVIPADGVDVTLDDIKAFCQGKIAHFKVPRYLSIVTEFPMTVTGKIRKIQMRDEAVAALGLGDIVADA